MANRILKAIAEGVALVMVLPAAISCRLGMIVLSAEKGFPGWSQAMSLVPGLSGVYLRRAFYRLILRRCGKGSCISFGTVFSHATVEIGANAYLGTYCVIGDTTIENDVLIGSHVSIMNGSRQHGIERLDVPVRQQPGVWPRITIGEDSWIGDRAIIMADVGKHCVVGAGAVVTEPVPDFAIVVGVPARIRGWRKTPAEAGNEESPPVRLANTA